MDVNFFLLYNVPVLSVELLAALAGTYYLNNTSSPFKNSKALVVFLWITLFVELVGCYAPIAYFSNYEYFSFIKDTPFQNNFWWYNMYTVLAFSFFSFYFLSFLRNKTLRKGFAIVTGLYILISSGIYIFTDSLFVSSNNFVFISGTILILLCVLSFYYVVLKSELLLKLMKFLPFYISVGVLVFNLCITPIEILSQYFSIGDGNELFVKLHINVILYANLFLYATFIYGFIKCSDKKKSYY